MTWEQMWEAINALMPATLAMRKPGDWWINWPVERKKSPFDGILSSICGNGSDPEGAVRDLWAEMLAASSGEGYLVIGATSDRRRAYRWNGYRWVDVEEGGIRHA